MQEARDFPNLRLPMASELRTCARESETHLRNGDASYFDRLLPRTDSWRMYGDFRDSAAYVDVESDGPRGEGKITVIGLSDGIRTKVFVAGRNLPEFPEAIRKYSLLVTYNGREFDVPFMCDTFGNIFERMGHIDLQYALERLGYARGLKQIQEQMGFRREGMLGSLDGRAAVWLWEEYQKGNKKALETLLRYNLEDVVVLQSLAEAVYNEASSSLPIPVTRLLPARRPVIDTPYDEDLVRRLAREHLVQRLRLKDLQDEAADEAVAMANVGRYAHRRRSRSRSW